MLLRLTDGTNTVILHDDAGTPSTGLLGALYFPRDMGTAETVSETARAVFNGSGSSIRTTINKIEALLRLGAERQKRAALPTVYLEYRHANAGYIWRSPVQGGRVTWAEDRSQRNLTLSSTSGEIGVIIDRAPYWEAPEETAGTSTLRNGLSSPYNRLGLNPILGTMPAPLKVIVTNASGSSFLANKFYLAVDNTVGLTSTQHLIDGGSTSWSAPLTHATRLFTLDIPDAVTEAAGGEEMQVLAAFTSLAASELYLKASLWTAFGGIYAPTQIGSGEVLAGNRKLINLGAMPVPPDGVSEIDLAVVISGYSAFSGSATLDFVQLVPARNSVLLEQTGYNFTNGASNVDDPIEGGAYHLYGGDRLGIVRRSGGPLMVYPNRDNSLFVLFDEGGTFTPSRQVTVTATYRPRYATI